MRRASNRSRTLLRRGSSGFALVWVIMTLAVIAALAAAAAPSLVTLDDRARAESAATDLRWIAAGFVFFGPLVGAYPGNVSELGIPLTTANRNSCRQPMTATNVANWDDLGPYAVYYTPTSGRWTAIGRVRDSVPVRPSPAHTTPIYVELPGVTAEDAAMLDLVVDHGFGDTVTYHAPVNDTTTVRYRVVSSDIVDNNRC